MYGTESHVVAVDLARPDAIQQILDQAREHSLTVDVVVNNAGFGDVMV